MADDNKPKARVYTVRKGTAKSKDFWIRIGSGWLHKKEGGGMNIQLDALPVDGRLIVLPISAKGETINPETGEVLDDDEIPS